MDTDAWVNADMLILSQQKIKLQIAEKTVHVAHLVKNLAVYFDRSLTIDKQLNTLYNVCYDDFRSIFGGIRQHIMTAICNTVAHVLIMPQLDYDNALLFDLPSRLMECLQNT